MTCMQDGVEKPAEPSDMEMIIRDEEASRLDFGVLASMRGESLSGPNSSQCKHAKALDAMDTILEEEEPVKPEVTSPFSCFVGLC